MAKTAPGGSGGGQSAVLGLPPIAFILTWFLMIGFHAACIAFLIVVGSAYISLTSEKYKSFPPMWSVTGGKYFKAFGAVFLAIAVLHLLQVLRIIFISIRQKRLILHCERSSCCKDECKQSKIAVWCFDVLFAVREMVAVGALSYQVYQSSYLVPRVWLNNLAVAILVIACWLTPLLQVLTRKSIGLSRALSLFSSFVLCTFLAKVVHYLLFRYYLDLFNVDHNVFIGNVVYDPTYMAILGPENRMLFATNIGELVSKFLPLFGSFVSLVMLEGVVSRRDEKVTPDGCATTAKVDPNSNVTVETLDTLDGTTEPAHLEAGTSTKALDESRTGEKCSQATLTKNPGCAWPFVVIKLLFIIWGVLVLAFHLKAQSQHKKMPTGCFVSTRPWFDSKVSCLSFAYDCAIQGALSPTDESFDAFNLDYKAVRNVNFVNCPALMVPSVVQSFTDLSTVQIFNSALYSWGSNAALVDELHPRLLSVILVKVQLATFPEGLMGELPQTLIFLQFLGTSLPSVPSDLGTRWGVGRNPIPRVGFEYGMLSAVPPEIFALPVTSLSLAGNFLLFTIPSLAAAPANTFLPQLTLDGAPLMMLPSVIDATVKIGDLSLEGTKVSVLPDWTQTQVLTKMHLYGSAFCLTSTDAQKEKANGICSTSRWGTTVPKSPIELLENVYGTP
ncbi:unnamed protein product [Phytophthora lilii]|uniref:Unnamed protein product n=1 Tax=Phytophthora lilii TaxID=2077276 RepID=A0A9W6UAZ7_9STRA|nr:unnamed protein product [Phytophthora lilii]